MKKLKIEKIEKLQNYKISKKKELIYPFHISILH